MLITTRSAVHVARFQLMTLVGGQRYERVAEGIRAPLILGLPRRHLNVGESAGGVVNLIAFWVGPMGSNFLSPCSTVTEAVVQAPTKSFAV